MKSDGKWKLTDGSSTVIAKFDLVKGEQYEVHLSKTDAEIEEEKENAFDTSKKFKSMCMIRSINDNNYGHIKQGLKESMYLGRDEFPTCVQATMELILNASGTLDYQRSKKTVQPNAKWK